MKAFVAPPRSAATNAYDLLQDVKKVILEEPLRLDMSIVCLRGEGISLDILKPACGTVGCLAGWVLVLTGRTKPNEANFGMTGEARDLLGLDREQGSRLFFPQDLISPENTRQTRAHARATIKHLDAFCEENKQQLREKAV